MELDILRECALFRGFDDKGIESVLGSSAARERAFDRGACILLQGERVRSLGIVLEGRARIENCDAWGKLSLIGSARPGSVFAETYAAAPDTPMLVSVVAETDCRILFLDVGRIMAGEGIGAEARTSIMENLVRIFAQKNLGLSRRILHSTPKTIRARLTAYLSFESDRQQSRDFVIPYDRQRLADYLSVDRSALSSEIGRMQREGLLESHRSRFVLKSGLEGAE